MRKGRCNVADRFCMLSRKGRLTRRTVPSLVFNIESLFAWRKSELSERKKTRNNRMVCDEREVTSSAVKMRLSRVLDREEVETMIGTYGTHLVRRGTSSTLDASLGLTLSNQTKSGNIISQRALLRLATAEAL